MNAPSTFQELMNKIFRPYLQKFNLVVFDDILLYSKTWDEHIQHLDLVLQILCDHHLHAMDNEWAIFVRVGYYIDRLRMMLECHRQYQIYRNLKKCILCAPFGALLGHVVCRNGILVDLSKVVIILDLPPPTMVKNLREKLRHTGYYRNFIKGYSEMTATMEKLLKNDTKFH